MASLSIRPLSNTLDHYWRPSFVLSKFCPRFCLNTEIKFELTSFQQELSKKPTQTHSPLCISGAECCCCSCNAARSVQLKRISSSPLVTCSSSLADPTTDPKAIQKKPASAHQSFSEDANDILRAPRKAPVQLARVSILSTLQ